MPSKDSFSFLDLAQEILSASQYPLTPDEIWQQAKNKGLDAKLKGNGKTPWRTLGARLYTHVKAKPGELIFRADGSPARFGLIGQHEGTVVPESTTLPPQSTPNAYPKIKHERDLHPYLANFAAGFLDDMAVQTIFHEKSKKLAFGEWLHPDVVGMRLLSKGWPSGAREIAQACGGSITRLYSFELKRSLKQVNLREAFFQCVSNSTWANEAWLVTAEVEQSNEFDQELKRLTGLFGVGVIKLDVDNPDASEVRIQARFKEDIDWDTVSKLAQHNPDFQVFLKNVKLSVHANEFVHKNQFDSIIIPE